MNDTLNLMLGGRPLVFAGTRASSPELPALAAAVEQGAGPFETRTEDDLLRSASAVAELRGEEFSAVASDEVSAEIDDDGAVI